MEIKAFKNQYNHQKIQCPFCEVFCTYRPVTKASPDPFRDLKRHITNEAKKEALEFYLSKDAVIVEHVEYYKNHTVNQKIVPTVKRNYDDDMQLKK